MHELSLHTVSYREVLANSFTPSISTVIKCLIRGSYSITVPFWQTFGPEDRIGEEYNDIKREVDVSSNVIDTRVVKIKIKFPYTTQGLILIF